MPEDQWSYEVTTKACLGLKMEAKSEVSDWYFLGSSLKANATNSFPTLTSIIINVIIELFVGTQIMSDGLAYSPIYQDFSSLILM